MNEKLILGLIQGFAEWLPVSSEGLITLVQVYFFSHEGSVTETIHLALFLHLGTFLAALVYFRRKIWSLIEPVLQMNEHPSRENQKIFLFLIISTVVSGTLGLGVLTFIESIESTLNLTGKYIMFAVGILLLITAFLQFYSSSRGLRDYNDLNWKDAVLIGIAQGFAVLPGLSRSGLTVSALLMVKIEEEKSLELSFLMSLPIVLSGNILLNYEHLIIDFPAFLGLMGSFVVGIITIHLLLKMAQSMNFGYFVLLFALITFVAAYFV